MLMPMNSPDGPTRYSLWHGLIDGSVSIWVRVLINLALSVFLTGLAFLMSFFLAALVPAFRYQWAYGLRPTDELMIGVFALCGLAFVGGTVWIWSRRSRHRALLRPTLWTMGIGTATTVLCVVAGETFRGAEEIVVLGLVLLAGGIVMLIWTNAWYQMSRGRPMRNAGDGLPDIRCPKCGYRMVGLRESRCPECGTAYTLDELLVSQHFSHPAPPAHPAEHRA
jgi:hypothetical protein